MATVEGDSLTSLRVSLCLILSVAIGLAGPAQARPRAHNRQVITGPARAFDGDTILIGRVHIRIYGADAFENDQMCGVMACGHKARAAMDGLIAHKVVRCEKQDTDDYGRTIAICTAAGVDLGREMVRRGLALAYRYYSLKYAADEDWAKAHKQGAWAFKFENPYRWRQAHKEAW